MVVPWKTLLFYYLFGNKSIELGGFSVFEVVGKYVFTE